jgi:ribosomal protein L21E
MSKRNCHKCEQLQDTDQLFAVVVNDARVAFCQDCYQTLHYKETPQDFVAGDLVLIQVPPGKRGNPTYHGKKAKVIKYDGNRWLVTIEGVGEKHYAGIHMRLLIAHCSCDPKKMWFGHGCECGASKRERASKASFVQD